jgi:hypothetical protein
MLFSSTLKSCKKVMLKNYQRKSGVMEKLSFLTIINVCKRFQNISAYTFLLTYFTFLSTDSPNQYRILHFMILILILFLQIIA